MTATRVRFKRGTTAQHASFTGADGEITINTSKNTAVVHDGSTQGGHELLRGDIDNLDSTATVPGSQIATIDAGLYSVITTALDISSGTTLQTQELVYNTTANKILSFDSDNANPSTITVKVGTVNTYASGTTISASSTVMASTASSYDVIQGVYDPDTDQTCIAYIDGTAIKVATGSVNSSGTVSFGTPVSVHTSNSPKIVGITYDTTNDKVLLFLHETTGDSTANLYLYTGTISSGSSSWSGTSLGTKNFIYYGGAAAYDSINDEWMCVAFYDNGSNTYGRAIVVGSGTTWGDLDDADLETFSQLYTSDTHGICLYPRLVNVGSRKYFIAGRGKAAYSGSTTIGHVITYTVSGSGSSTTPSITTHSYNGPSNSSVSNSVKVALGWDGNHLLLVYSGTLSYTADEYAIAVRGTISNNSVSWDLEEQLNTYDQESYNYEGVMTYNSSLGSFATTSLKAVGYSDFTEEVKLVTAT